MKKTTDNLQTDNWYYVQAFRKEGFKVRYTIVFAKDKAEAIKKAEAWAEENGLDGQIHYYLKNYKREAKLMVSDGNYI